MAAVHVHVCEDTARKGAATEGQITCPCISANKMGVLLLYYILQNTLNM